MALNTWHHVVFIFDYQRSAFRYYVDGVQEFEGLITEITGLDRKPLRISQHTVYSFKGLLDEVAFFDRPLTEKEISELWRHGSLGRTLSE